MSIEVKGKTNEWLPKHYYYDTYSVFIPLDALQKYVGNTDHSWIGKTRHTDLFSRVLRCSLMKQSTGEDFQTMLNSVDVS